MEKPTEPVYFVHISDSHFGPTAAYERHGYRPQPCVERAVEIINNLPTRPDFVVHTGDVVTDPDEEAYRRATAVFQQLQMPVYFVTGNHDRSRDIKQYMQLGPHQSVSTDPDVLSYAFEVKGYRFVVLDGRGPDEIDPHGVLSEAQMQVVRTEATAVGPPLTIFVHFPTLPMNSIWMDKNMPLLNGAAFHEALLPARTLPHGAQRKLELGMILAPDPEILLLDEPTAGMASEQVPELMALIQKIQEAGHKTVMLVEHNMNVVMSVSDTITVMHHGAVLAEGSPAEISANETVQTAYLGHLYEDTAVAN